MLKNEEQKNFILEYSDIDNGDDLCERCKNAKVTLTCSECSPFHNYCDKCDKIIHQLPSRENHNRTSVLENAPISINLNRHHSSSNIAINNPISKDIINNNNLYRTAYQISNSHSAQNLVQDIDDNNIPVEEMPQYINNNINNIPNANNYSNIPQIIAKSPQNSFFSGEILNNQSLNNDLKNLNNIDYI